VTASPGARRAAWIGAVAGAVVAGVAAGNATEHRLVRARRQRPGAAVAAPADPVDLRPRALTVVAGDGVPLHVEEVGPPDAPLTIVLVHGFCVTSRSWQLQCRDLARAGRVVVYDQRSHGRSGASDAGEATIDRLGDDLLHVLTDRVPDGQVVLVGHSMGGMTVMALAERHPELFGSRIVGVGLLSTSAGKLAVLTFGLPAVAGKAMQRLLPGLSVGVRRFPAWAERGRRRGSDIAYVLTRRLAFGSPDVPPALVELMESMVTSIPADVIAAFLPTFLDHDKLGALGVLPLVLVGGSDMVTPPDHSREIALALPAARLVVVPGAGHMVVLERAAEVNEQLRALVDRARRRGPATLTEP
jgi:pimeloyl-ACP methyl ester carboxylesterase